MMMAMGSCVVRGLAVGLAAAALGMAASGCRGHGRGLDSTGQPIKPVAAATPTPDAGAPTFGSLLASTFTPKCKACHTGGAAPHGLVWDTGSATQAEIWNNVVNKASSEQAALFRVAIGLPNTSYVIQKLEGAGTITGGRMPLGGPYLTTAEIDQVRAWITDGAKNN